MNNIEIDCRTCANYVTGKGCAVYGNNPISAVLACAKDGFSSYMDRWHFRLRENDTDPDDQPVKRMLLVIKTETYFKPAVMDIRRDQLLREAKQGLIMLRPDEEVYVVHNDSGYVPHVRLLPEEDAHGTV